MREFVPLKRRSCIQYGLGQPPKLADNGIAIIRATNIFRGKIIANDLIYASLEDIPLDRVPLLKAGEVLVVRSGAYTGDSALVTPEWAGCAPGYDLRITAGPGLEPRFLAYTMLGRRVMDEIDLAKSRAAQPHLNAEDVGQVGVLDAPISKQRTIIKYLDDETARIDALIVAKRRMIELLEDEFRSIQATLLTGEQHNYRKGHAVFGNLPKHWSARRAKFCTDGITVGVVVNPSTYFVDDGIPFIHGTDVREGSINTANMKMLSAESNAILAKSQVRAGDVVAMRVGYPGRAAVVPHSLDGSNCASVLIFRRSPELLPELVCEFLNSPLGRAQIQAVQYGAAQEVMNVSDAVDLCLPVPPAGEQASMVAQLHAARDRWQKSCALLEHSVILLQERRQALITAAVTGQLDIPEAA